jgi:hypothetical protein
VYELFTSPDNAVPPVGVVYQTYCPFVPPETERAILPVPQEVPLTGEVGAGGVTQNGVALIAVPPGVATEIFPVDPVPTTASIEVGVVTVKEAAAVPPKLTRVAPVKFIPVMVTVAPLPALVGVNEEIVGNETKTKPALVAVPAGVVTETFPLVPAPTNASMEVEEFIANDVAAVPPKLTVVAPVKLVPVMVTVAPLPALVGVNEEIVGAGIKTKPALVAVPPSVVTETFPLAPAPTTASMEVEEFIIYDVAAVPPKLTADAPVKFVPVMVTVAPLPALVGVNEEIVGAETKTKPALVAVPPAVVTETFPLAPAPTTASMEVEEFIVNDVAAVPPKLTAVAPVKFAPVIVTVVPTIPLAGVKDAIVGTGALTVLRNTDTVALLLFATARSALPSPSRSPIETE